MPNSRPDGREPSAPLPGLRVEPLRADDLDEVLEIERASFRSPWKRVHFLHEIEANPHAVNRALRREGRLLGYACVWYLEGELTINNIAIHPEFRRMGLGGWFLRSVLRDAVRRRCRTARLEVRPSNRAARRLYRDHGFVEAGRRKNYYQQEGEDAIVMVADLSGSRRFD